MEMFILLVWGDVRAAVTKRSPSMQDDLVLAHSLASVLRYMCSYPRHGTGTVAKRETKRLYAIAAYDAVFFVFLSTAVPL